MQTQPSPIYHQVVSLIRQLSPLEQSFLSASLPGLITKQGGETEDLHLMPSGEDMAAKVLKMLKTPETFTGPESALLAGVLIQHGTQFGLGADDSFDSRSITQELRREGRNVSNITSVMDSLVEKAFVEKLDEGKKGTHREYRVTSRGSHEVLRIFRRFDEKFPEVA